MWRVLKRLSADSDEPVQHPVKLETPNDVRSVALIHILFKRQANALIRLRECADWSEPLLVAHTTLLEISCHGSNMKGPKIYVSFITYPFSRKSAVVFLFNP